MSDPAPDPATEAILPRDEAKRRFLMYLVIRFAGLGLLGGGLLLSRQGPTIPGILLSVLGLASLFIRPRLLGLTGGRKR